jgi:hypothetical protein
MCLLSEIAYELDKDFEPHLAVLLHAAVGDALKIKSNCTTAESAVANQSPRSGT